MNDLGNVLHAVTFKYNWRKLSDIPLDNTLCVVMLSCKWMHLYWLLL